jgi:two-component system OmpR family response regulator
MPAQPLNRICYVEDDEDIQRIVRMSLEKVGKMEVLVCGDPMVAIAKITEYKPQLVMLDWMMPGMDGPTLFKEMKKVEATQGLPVVFITAKASERELNELKTLGAAGTISKPFSPRDLPDQLRAIWSALP